MMLPITLISACSQVQQHPPEVIESASAPAAALLKKNQGDGSLLLSQTRRVMIPRSAPWLAEPLHAAYKRVPASVAIEEIAQSRPVRLTFEVEVDPLVSTPLSAITMQDHLNALCRQADWTYTIDDGVVLVQDIETKTFPLSSQPGTSTANLNLRGLKSSGGDDDNTGNSVIVDLDPFAREIEGVIRGVLNIGDNADSSADQRTAVTVLPSINSVVVTAKPPRMRHVERVLSQYNEAAAKAVRLHIALFEVDLSDSEERGLNLVALRDAAVSWGASISTDTPNTNGSVMSVAFNEGNAYDNSTAVYNWLQTQGHTSIAFEDAFEVRNNSVGSVDATQTRRYVSQISRETQTAGATQTEAPTVEFDELRVGWAIHLQPTIIDDVVTVRLGLSRSTFVEEQPYSFDEGRIAGTNFVTDDYNRAMAVTLRDGETKLLTSLASKEFRDTRKRTPWLPWAGDGRSRSSRDRETVMIMTAYVL